MTARARRMPTFAASPTWMRVHARRQTGRYFSATM
jgi:hypothetical protein